MRSLLETYVPLQAVFLDRAGTASFVSVGGEVERREVKTGQYNDLWVQILDGLREGETVLMSAPPGFDAKAKVEPVEVESDAASS